jgi:F-box/leucine-rich repeat protein 2/20
LEAVAKLSNLEHFELFSSNQISDTGFGLVANGCKKLRVFVAPYSSMMQDASLASLAAACLDLRYVNVHHCYGLTDVGIGHLSACRHLRVLNINCIPHLTDDGIEALTEPTPQRPRWQHRAGEYYEHNSWMYEAPSEGCGDLRVINMDGGNNASQLTDRAMGHLARGCPLLQCITFCECPLVTDRGVERLANGCSNLIPGNVFWKSRKPGATLTEPLVGFEKRPGGARGTFDTQAL